MENDRRQHRKRWRKEDEHYIRNHFNEEDKLLAVRFGRSVGAIRQIKRKITLSNLPKKGTQLSLF